MTTAGETSLPANTRGEIYVLAGTNGAGKSSIFARELELKDIPFTNPDAMALRIVEDDPMLGLDRANSQAWGEMVRLLANAIRDQKFFAFETTLGANTIPRMLREASQLGLDVRIAYVGLISADLHVQRVRRRVAGGGHPVPEARIRARYDSSRQNLVRLLPYLRELWLYDNSVEAEEPEPFHIMHTENRIIVTCCVADEVPNWARPIVRAAIELNQASI